MKKEHEHDQFKLDLATTFLRFLNKIKTSGLNEIELRTCTVHKRYTIIIDILGYTHKRYINININTDININKIIFFYKQHMHPYRGTNCFM